MAASVALEPRSWSGEGVRIADVARKLRELRAAEGDTVHSTLTSVMNLVACAPSLDAASEIESVTDGLRDHHPSRAVIVIPADGGDRIDARVEVMSHTDRPSGLTLQVEQIVLTLQRRGRRPRRERRDPAAAVGAADVPLVAGGAGAGLDDLRRARAHRRPARHRDGPGAAGRSRTRADGGDRRDRRAHRSPIWPGR